MMRCSRCNSALDVRTGRHLDEDGQVMSQREDMIQCRPAPEVGSLSWWMAQDDKTGCPPSILRMIDISKTPSSPVNYRGFDISMGG